MISLPVTCQLCLSDTCHFIIQSVLTYVRNKSILQLSAAINNYKFRRMQDYLLKIRTQIKYLLTYRLGVEWLYIIFRFFLNRTTE